MLATLGMFLFSMNQGQEEGTSRRHWAGGRVMGDDECVRGVQITQSLGIIAKVFAFTLNEMRSPCKVLCRDGT